MSVGASSPSAFLVLRISMHEPRYHGQPEWPPAPARAFQALVAGAGRGMGLAQDDANALEWLETLPPPVIGAPKARWGRGSQFWVPNNDLDSKGGDPQRVCEIRAAKEVHPRLFAGSVPFLYSWELPDTAGDRESANRICAVAEKLYQFGRGMDMAWAVAAVLDQESWTGELDRYAGDVLQPSPGRSESMLLCPHPGSLARLVARFEAAKHRFSVEGQGRASVRVFTQPPMVSFSEVAYGGGVDLRLYELQHPDKLGTTVPLSLIRAHDLVVRLRDGAAEELRRAFPNEATTVDDVVVGRRPGVPTSVRPEQRVRIIPLPSIGHPHADLGIRRVAIQMPQGSPLAAGDVAWAFSRLSLADPDAVLVRADDRRMLTHYGCGPHQTSRVWRTVTPAALPETIKRRRIDPKSPKEQAKDGAERTSEERRASQAVPAALRHAGVRARVQAIRVQREPFDRNGERVEAFAAGTRFAKERLWHIEIEFRESPRGPVVIGDGRFLGLGVMRPARAHDETLAFRVVSGLTTHSGAFVIARAFRRAVIARYQELIGPWARVPGAVLGHARRGGPANDAPRVAYVFDATRSRLLLFFRHMQRRDPSARRVFQRVAEAMDGFVELRAGSGGVLQIEHVPFDADNDPLTRPSRSWVSATPYVVNRHEARGRAGDAVAADLRHACRLQGLAQPASVTVDRTWGESGLGLAAEARLTFEVAVSGPVLLGKMRFQGGGLFEASG